MNLAFTQPPSDDWSETCSQRPLPADRGPFSAWLIATDVCHGVSVATIGSSVSGPARILRTSSSSTAIAVQTRPSAAVVTLRSDPAWPCDPSTFGDETSGGGDTEAVVLAELEDPASISSDASVAESRAAGSADWRLQLEDTSNATNIAETTAGLAVIGRFEPDVVGCTGREAK